MANVKGNALTAQTTVALTDIIIVVNPTTGQAYRTTVSQFLTSVGSVTNATTTALSEATLDTDYPSAVLGFEVICKDITDGPMIYKKSSTDWYSIPLGTV